MAVNLKISLTIVFLAAGLLSSCGSGTDNLSRTNASEVVQEPTPTEQTQVDPCAEAIPSWSRSLDTLSDITSEMLMVDESGTMVLVVQQELDKTRELEAEITDSALRASVAETGDAVQSFVRTVEANPGTPEILMGQQKILEGQAKALGLCATKPE